MKISLNRGAFGGRGAAPWRLPISRFVLTAVMGCFYIAFSGNQSIVEERSNLASLVDIGNNQPTSPKFPEYPLTREAMLAIGAQMGRSAVPVMKARPHWCHQKSISDTNFMTPNANSTKEGLFFVKTPKTASQTINRILRRLATRVGRARQNTPCSFRGHHIQGDPAAWYSHRHANRSVLLTSLRDPATRALSRIYWTLSTRQHKGPVHVERLRKTLTRTDVETGCVSEGQGGFQLNYVSFPTIPQYSAWTQEEPDRVQNPAQIHRWVEQVLQDYDFILVQERLEESLVAMQLLLGLETADVLSMPLHVGGSHLYDRHAGCLELLSPPAIPHLNPGRPPSVATPTTSVQVIQFLDDYFRSPTWQAQNYGDYVLLGAAQASLDRTIRDLGAADFPAALERFRTMQQKVLEVCSDKVVFPCSFNGTIQRDDYQLGRPSAAGDRYPQEDIEDCIDQVVRDQYLAT